jgi:hypothetical protein
MIFIFTLFGAVIMAQQADTAALLQPSVKVSTGNLLINGRVITGLRVRQLDQDGVKGDTTLEAINQEMDENRVELSLNYTNANYGAFVMFQALSPSAWSFSANDVPSIRFASIYANYLDNKLKVSVGKLYDEVYQLREKVWKTEGESGGMRFTDEKNFSSRIEFKPIPGLNVGAQIFFVSPSTGGKAEIGEFMQEIGIGGMYTSDLFNAQAGLRLDGAADGLDRTSEYKSYLWYYYGGGANPIKYKHGDQQDDYDGGTYAFAGFNLKAVKDLTTIAQAGFYNVGDWDKYGYAKMDENIRYTILSKINIGVKFLQEFYGNDVMDSGYVNSPFFQFKPGVSYKINDTFTGMLEGNIGVCKDVLDSYWYIKPIVNITLGGYGSFRAQVFYEYLSQKFESMNDPINRNTFGIGLDLMF